MSFVVYNSAVQDFFDGTQDWDTDNHYCMLVQSSYTPSLSHTTVLDVSAHEVVEGDYSPKNMTAESVVVSGDDTVCDAADVNFGNPVTITTAKYAVIAVGTVGTKSNADLLVGYVDLGAVSIAGGPFNIRWDATNGIFRITREGGPDSITMRDGSLLYLQQIADAEPNTITLLGPYREFPGLRDYGGEYTDAELSNATSLKSPDRRGIYGGNARRTSSFPAKPALALTGSLVLRAAIDIVDPISSGLNIIDYGSGGGGQDDNYLWNLNISGTNLSYFAERGPESSNNLSVSWFLPGRNLSGREYLYEFRRTAGGDLAAYINGYQLRKPTNSSSASGTSINADGTASGMTPDGGANAYLCEQGLGNSSLIDLYYAHICSDDTSTQSASSYAEANNFYFTDEDWDFIARDNYAAISADPDVVVSLNPTSGNLVDDAGTIGTWNTTGTISDYIGDVLWTDVGGGDWREDNNPATQITGDVTVNILFMYNSTNGSLVSQEGPSGDGNSANNFLYRLGLVNSTTFDYFAEEGTGTNISVQWTIDQLLDKEIRELRFVRESDGGGGQNVRLYQKKQGGSWEQMTVSSTSGTGVGTTEANVNPPFDGSASDLFVFDVAYYREIAIYNAAKNPI